MASDRDDSGSELDQRLLWVASSPSQQRPSIVSLGEESRGLPGLLSPSNRPDASTFQLEGREIADKGAPDKNGSRYAVTEFTSTGFIVSTDQVLEDVEENREANEATSEFVLNSGSSSYVGSERGESHITIQPNTSGSEGMSSSEEEDPNDAFNRGGHQGSYFLRKGVNKLEEQRPNSVIVTPISSLDRAQRQNLDLESGSEDDDENLEEVVGKKTHKSLYLKRGKRRRSSFGGPLDTVIANPAIADIEQAVPAATSEGEPQPIETDSDPEVAVLDGEIRERVKKSILILQDKSMVSRKLRKPCIPKRCFPCLESTTEPYLSPELQQAQKLGFKMFPFFVFPALPALLQDVWVTVELIVTFFEFLFACITFGDGGLVNALVVALSLLNLMLASFDSFLYFVEGGSCVRLFKWGKRKYKMRKESKNDGGSSKKGDGGIEEETDSENEDENSKAATKEKVGFQKKFRKIFAVSSEVVRISLTEILLYPLTILDLYELIGSRTYTLSSNTDRINFGLLIIGLFYLILTVYAIRILMALSAVVSISRLPKTTSNNYHNLLRKFALHIIGQIIVHALILVMAAKKIENEFCFSTFNDAIDFVSIPPGSGGLGSGSSELGSGSSGSGSEVQSSSPSEPSVNTSPFLIVSVITGGIIPFLGVAMFFVVNYPALKQFMMGFCIDMMSTIVAEDFATATFSGSGLKKVNRKMSTISNKVTSLRQQYKLYTNIFSLKRKVSYRLTNPLVVLLSLAYFTLLAVFLTSHVLGWKEPCDSSSGVIFIAYGGVFVTFIIGVVAMAVANYQVVLVSVIWLIALTGLVLLIASAPITTLICALLISVVVLVTATT